MNRLVTFGLGIRWWSAANLLTFWLFSIQSFGLPNICDRTLSASKSTRFLLLSEDDTYNALMRENGQVGLRATIEDTVAFRGWPLDLLGRFETVSSPPSRSSSKSVLFKKTYFIFGEEVVFVLQSRYGEQDLGWLKPENWETPKMYFWSAKSSKPLDRFVAWSLARLIGMAAGKVGADQPKSKDLGDWLIDAGTGTRGIPAQMKSGPHELSKLNGFPDYVREVLNLLDEVAGTTSGI